MFRCSAHRLSQTRRAVSLRWHSAPSRAGPRRSRGFSSSVAAAGFPPTAPSPSVSSPFTAPIPPPSLRLHSAFTPSLKPLLPARLTRPKCVTVPPKFNHPCQSRKDHHLSPRPPYRPAPAAPVGLPTHSPEDRKNDASASPFPTSSESSDGYIHALNSVHNGITSHARSEDKEYIHKQQKALSRFCNSLYQHCIQIRYIGDCHQYAINHLCG